MANGDFLNEWEEREEQRKAWGTAASRRLKRLQDARLKGTHTKKQWLDILDEVSYRCVRCQCIPVGRPCKDHIVPILDGGSDGIDNLQPLCRECNSEKKSDSYSWLEHRRKHGWDE